MKRFILFLLFLLSIAISATAQVQPTDTDGDGYINISTLDHLRWVSENSSSWDKNFELDNNINASATANWNDSAGFKPIGNFSICFSGKFEGKGFSIDSLHIKRPSNGCIGLFGMTCKAAITNVGITNCQIIGYYEVGGLVGNNSYSTVSNSYCNGSVTGKNSVGGLVGVNHQHSTISNSYSNSSVAGNTYVGGIVGENDNSTLINSYSKGTVSGSISAGGLVGLNIYEAIVINCFWDKQTSGQNASAGGTGKTSAEMITKSIYTKSYWNFNSVWAIDSKINNGYPYIIEREIADIPGIEPFDDDADGYRNISCYSHLRWISKNDSSWSWNFELDNDIHSDTTFYLLGDQGITPIGNGLIPFSGKFEGNGFTIDSIYINRAKIDYIGLFGRTNGAEISDLGVINCLIIGNSYVGGIVGVNDSSAVSNCYSICNIYGNSYVGGMVGQNYYSTIINSYSIGMVSGKSYLGGLVGHNYYSKAINSFWDIQTSGQTWSYGGIGKTTAEMKTKSTFTSASWNFDLVWTIDSTINGGFPYLNDRGLNLLGMEPIDTDGDGYRNISCYSHLHWVSKNDTSWSWSFELDNDINADTTRLLSGDIGFNPIGNRKRYFSGNFEGNGFTIDSLYINKIGTNFIGLFGRTSRVEISNVGITNCLVNGSNFVGGLVGWNDSSSISHINITGSVTGSNSVGGIVGSNCFSIVNTSYTTCSISGDENVGGLVGDNTYSTITDSKTMSSVFGSFDIGGVAGTNSKNSMLSSSYCIGSVVGFENVGGVVGVNSASQVNSCYNTGNVSGKHSYIGGIVGYNFISSIVDKCYCTGNVSGKDDIGGIVGINDGKSTISDCYNLGKVSGDYYIGGIVGYNNGSNVNNSYCTGDIYGDSSGVGGLVGGNYQLSTVSNSYSTGNVSGLNYTGGLVGVTNQSWIIKNYSTGHVTGNQYIGGLVGLNEYSTLSDSYSTGNVSGVSGVGGFVGYNRYSMLSNSYSIGNVSGNKNVGGLVGYEHSSTVNNSFWDTQKCGVDTSAGGIGKTTTEMKTKLTFTSAGWNFDTTWAIAADYNSGYPNLDGKNDPIGIIEVHSVGLIYPQPAKDVIFIRLTERTEDTAHIKLYDQAGQIALTMKTSVNNGLIKLNTSPLSSGVYQILINVDGKTYSEKVVISK